MSTDPTTPELRAHSEARLLPVAWDGHPVEWGDFTTDPTLCRLGDDGVMFEALPPDLCWHCGVRAERVTAEGRVAIRWPYRLILRRCTRCGHDCVRNPATRQEWDLDESDYGPTGSWETP